MFKDTRKSDACHGNFFDVLTAGRGGLMLLALGTD